MSVRRPNWQHCARRRIDDVAKRRSKIWRRLPVALAQAPALTKISASKSDKSLVTFVYIYKYSIYI